MTAHDIAIVVLLAVGSFVAVVGSVGVLAARTFYDRLHYLGMTTVAALPLGLAVAIGEPSAGGVAKALLVTAVVVAVGPVLTHAIARAELNRQQKAGAAPRDAGERQHRKAG